MRWRVAVLTATYGVFESIFYCLSLQNETDCVNYAESHYSLFGNKQKGTSASLVGKVKLNYIFNNNITIYSFYYSNLTAF